MDLAVNGNRAQTAGGCRGHATQWAHNQGVRSQGFRLGWHCRSETHARAQRHWHSRPPRARGRDGSCTTGCPDGPTDGTPVKYPIVPRSNRAWGTFVTIGNSAPAPTGCATSSSQGPSMDASHYPGNPHRRSLQAQAGDYQRLPDGAAGHLSGYPARTHRRNGLLRRSSDVRRNRMTAVSSAWKPLGKRPAPPPPAYGSGPPGRRTRTG